MKVAVIGAGICGLYLAWKLAEKGNNITVFEKKERIGKETCSGLFSGRILQFIPESKKLIQNQIDYCLIHFPKRTLKICFRKKFFVMNHFELDNLAANLAAKAGAKIFLNHQIKDLPENFEKIIGCDGANSALRKILKLSEPEYKLAIQGFITKVNFLDDRIKNKYSNFVETWPTKSGFLWKIPRAGEIEYGIMEKPHQARELFKEFLKENNLNLGRINSAIIPQGLIISSNPKITLCGDATGLTKPWSGGGVVWSLIAADILLKNFPDFSKYQKEIKKFFLPKIIFSKIATRMVYFLGFKIPWLFPKELKIEEDFLI